ncbi:MAG: hypothetical protein LBI10_13210 [Deltaproteobacteria bacterium]|jgi:hypothetical protein|nr:hypothetical protein [Deltaproteobacteria bacterium]
MSLLRLALIVSAQRELTFSADDAPLGGPDSTGLKVIQEEFDTLEGPAHRDIGVATVAQIFLVGAEIVDLTNPAASLTLSWYLPGEESPDQARLLDVNQVGLIPQDLKPEPLTPGREWWHKLEARGPVKETLFFESGFQPPFKPSQLTLYATDLKNFGLSSFILGQVMYGRKVPAYTEAEWGFTQTVSEGRLAL